SAAPSHLWRLLSYPNRPRPVPSGVAAVQHCVTGQLTRRRVNSRGLLRRAERVLRLAERFKDRSDNALRGEAIELHARFRLGRDCPRDLDAAFAVVREVAFRQLGERPFPVQIAGALAIEAGCIAEMGTGEGKTLTATLPIVVAGWRGRACHVVTVNDYLARRDAEWMRGIYEFCGLRVASVQAEMEPDERRKAYAADVTYCTSREVVADFLRDQIALGPRRHLPQILVEKIAGRRSVYPGPVLRGLDFALIDEADSVLIDEAVIPLLIEGGPAHSEQEAAYRLASDLAAGMQSTTDYRLDPRRRDVVLTVLGANRVAEATRTMGGVWRDRRRGEELLVHALWAREYLQRDAHYLVKDERVTLIDELTGRSTPDRTLRDGLHQAVEAREQLTISANRETRARISFQRFFRLYPRLSGMTGTAAESAREFWGVYALPVVVLPPNRPCRRRELPDHVFATNVAKWDAVVAEIRRVHQEGRPLLVGVRTVTDSERLSRRLTAEGLSHSVLNATRHSDEAAIVAQAGLAGRITVATNMAGRGTDIRLGPGVAERGGLHVLATERQPSRRVDRQLRGRAARQADPGSTQSFVSLDDELLCRYAPNVSHLLGDLSRRFSFEIPQPLARLLLEYAQRRAERDARSRRNQVLRTDQWLDEFLPHWTTGF
ncbi:MAG: prepilin peptidase, partial [Planctomycetota bacterium]